MPDGSLPPSVARFTRDGVVVGLGVLVGTRQVVTCAHVVNLALGREKLAGDRPDHVEVHVGGQTLVAAVEQWVPPPVREGAPGDDVAGLVLDVDVPVPPARLVTTLPGVGQEVRVFGYPGKPVRPNGSWVTGVVRGEVDGGLVQLDSASAIHVQPGFSGSPVWDVAGGRVIGIVATAGRGAADSYAVGADRLRQVWPEVLDRRRRRVDDGLDELTIVQPAGPRFGGDVPPATGRLVEDLADVHPDLLVVAGDLTEHGLRSEFEQAFAWLGEVAEAVELPRDRVVVVPGAHDVNRKACLAYFLRMEAEEREPLPPYWAKWEQYAEAFQRFYRDVPVAFTADEPWSLFEVPDLAVAVAGFNSTMADSHLGEVEPEFGDEQLTRLSRRLAEFGDRGWFRIGVTNRGRSVRGRPHVVVAGLRTLNSYDVLRIDPTGFDRRTRLLVDGHWTSESHLRTERRWSAESTFGTRKHRPPAPHVRQPDGFFERVVEATKVDRPAATVTPNRANSYLRVTERRPGGGVEQWPVFVTDGPVTREVLDGFRDTHLRFAEQDPQTRSELVHGGPPAPADVVAHALSLGIRVRSWIDYQGLVDLRALEEQQRRALADDVIYPAELYVPQRFRELGRLRSGHVQVDLLDRVVRWLAADSARFVMVLGDFGRGKSFLLRQLARELPTRLRGLTPVLIELRSLEKAPSLDTLLIQHLSRAGVEEISAPKLKYMIDSGRVALLFDGFDELELRVGYDNATDYLRVLLHRVDDRAKVVLTSRTQHFRLTSDVLNVLGEQVTSMASSRVALLEDFTDEQIHDFLTRHYKGDADRARARFDLLGDVRDLLGLSRNPRMLSFIADLDEERLREVERQEGRISAAELYRELVDHWLVKETDRQRHPSGLPSLDERERLDVCTTLALRLWATTASAIRESDLGAAAATLARLTERGYSHAQAQHAVGSGTLLVHTEDGFGFVHQSVMEWLVANAAAGRPDTDITNRVMSPLMVDFFCDLAGHDTAREWARGVPADAPEAVKQNASAVLARLGGAEQTDLSGMDLRARDLAALDLREAKLSRADLRGQRWTDVVLTGADLTGADLTGVRVTGGDLTGADLTGTTWRRAALVGVRGVEDRPELAEAAVVGRDPAEVVLGASGGAEAVAYSPDGELLAVSRGSVVELVDAGTDKVLRVLRGHRDWVLDVAFSPDGTRVVTASADGTARIHQVTGEHLATLTGHDGPVWAVAVSPEGRFVATAGDDNTTRLWFGGKHFATLEGRTGPVWAVDFAPGGDRLATASADGTVLIWTRTGNLAGKINTRQGALRDVAYSPNSTHLVTAGADGTARLWTVGGGSAAAFRGHTGPLWAVAFSPDGNTVATASEDGTARLWDVDGRLLAVFEGHAGPVRDVVFTHDGSRLTTTCTDGTVRSWSTDAGRLLSVVPHSGGPVHCAIWSPDGMELATASHGRTHVWTATGAFHFKDDRATRIAYAPGRMELATAATDGSVRVWYRGGMPARLIRAHDGPVNDVTYSPNSRYVATAGDDATAAVWSNDGKELARIRDHGDKVTAVAFSPDGTELATASHDGTVRRWVAMTGEAVDRIGGKLGPVNDVAYSPDGRRLAIGSRDGFAALWGPSHQLRFLQGHSKQVWAVAWSPDGRTVATASEDGTARTWTVGGKPIATFEGHDGPVWTVEFAPDGSHLVTGSFDGTTRIWSVDGDPLVTLMSSPHGWAAVTPDGAYRTGGEVSDMLWWAVKLCRFEVGELDGYYENARPMADGEPIPGLRPATR
ncbi:trypsin-like peptidase domain-containing protein [Saccharothrix variisporea]|uniref:Serine protease n=1 Tax=Saccharothrix variisporea TaxID=543527 RepID=A0A495XGI7_9PSEU|nr:trypsin-like peptidase domain-containing protein [Saccharothrix variisporea]RKT72316.1 WD40 repeat protein [Saccharothrix variisporea]